MGITIDDAIAADAQVICDFNRLLALETENIRLNPERVLAGVHALLSDPTKGRYWLAKDGARIVGQVMVTYEWSDWSNASYWWLGSVYVDAEYRGQGIFKNLFEHVAQMAQADAAAAIRLYVEHDNHRAQNVYRNLGMSNSHYHIMALELSV
ncbi:MAG: GNAT family N-acetyltransferase [Pseudomonadota bacterium]